MEKKDEEKQRDVNQFIDENINRFLVDTLKEREEFKGDFLLRSNPFDPNTK